MTEQSLFLKALMYAEQSKRERLQKISEILSDLPDDFDWDELERLLNK